MKVFISWSGVRSHKVAIAARALLPLVLAEKVELFVSSEDISPGERGLSRIAEALVDAKFGILVITPENADSPWVNFEAGALSNAFARDAVVPLLVGMTDPDVTGPLKQFQNRVAADKAAVLDLVRRVNALLDDPLPQVSVDGLFEINWPAFANTVDEVIASDPAAAPVTRTSEEMLEELVSMTRALQRQVLNLQPQKQFRDPMGDGTREALGELRRLARQGGLGRSDFQISFAGNRFYLKLPVDNDITSDMKLAWTDEMHQRGYSLSISDFSPELVTATSFASMPTDFDDLRRREHEADDEADSHQ
nr:toll/interleukin-1 receptor domain-containing protein [Plantibacter sp. CFBP 8775]